VKLGREAGLSGLRAQVRLGERGGGFDRGMWFVSRDAIREG